MSLRMCVCVCVRANANMATNWERTNWTKLRVRSCVNCRRAAHIVEVELHKQREWERERGVSHVRQANLLFILSTHGNKRMHVRLIKRRSKCIKQVPLHSRRSPCVMCVYGECDNEPKTETETETKTIKKGSKRFTWNPFRMAAAQYC